LTNPIDFTGRAVIVTGAGGGLGRAEALDLAGRGASVVVNDVDAKRAEAVASEVEAAGGKAVAISVSVTSADAGYQLTSAALDSFQRVDVLINNAGYLRPNLFADMTAERLDAILDVHLRSTYILTQSVWRAMCEQGYGRIVMTSSSGGMFGVPGMSNYSAAKAGIYGLTKALAFEGQGLGIKVNCLLPYARTLIRSTDPDPEIVRNSELLAAAWQDSPLPVLPAEQLAWRSDPSAVAPLVTYLASEQCEPTGEAFSACLGRFARVFVGVSKGWVAGTPADATAESVAAQVDDIRDLSVTSVPMWSFDYMADAARQVLRETSN
jgi:NAD(P)-dependent dehydrogenase (short-subunit alcohol dehydrogenase family)